MSSENPPFGTTKPKDSPFEEAVLAREFEPSEIELAKDRIAEMRIAEESTSDGVVSALPDATIIPEQVRGQHEQAEAILPERAETLRAKQAEEPNRMPGSEEYYISETEPVVEHPAQSVVPAEVPESIETHDAHEEEVDSFSEYKAKEYPLTVIPPSEVITAQDAEKLKDVRDRLSGRTKNKEIPVTLLQNERTESPDAADSYEEPIVEHDAPDARGPWGRRDGAKDPSHKKNKNKNEGGGHAAGHGGLNMQSIGYRIGWFFSLIGTMFKDLFSGGSRGGGGHAPKPKAAAGGHGGGGGGHH